LVHVSLAGAVTSTTHVTTAGAGMPHFVLSGSTGFASWLESSGSRSSIGDTPGYLMGRATLAVVYP
jgi:hypothetical protein